MMPPRASVLEPIGPQADAIASLWNVFLGVAIVVWSLVVVATIVAAILAHRRRRRDGDGEPLADQPERDRRLVRAIVVAGALTLVTLGGLLVASISTGGALADLEADPSALHVEIKGHQWWWQITYEPDDPRATAATANELHVPVGQPVHLHLTSNDVIHSFWMPNVHGKRDMIPGRINTMWIRVDEPGVYTGQCAEFCGRQHANMTITLVAEPPEQFAAWLAAQRAPARRPVTAEQKHGEAVFLGGPCVLCHEVSGTQAGGRLGPDLTHFGSRRTIGASTVPNTLGHLTAWLTDPHGVKDGVRMPATLLPDADRRALAAYLRGLQ